MAASRGMAMPTVGADGAVRVTACVTPEMAARKQIPTGQPGDCKSKNTDIAGGMNVSFTCANPKSSGEGQVLLQRRPGFQHAAGGDDQRARHAGTGERDEQRQVAGRQLPCPSYDGSSEAVTEAHIKSGVATSRVAGIAHRVAGAVLVVDLRVGRVEIAAL